MASAGAKVILIENSGPWVNRIVRAVNQRTEEEEENEKEEDGDNKHNDVERTERELKALRTNAGRCSFRKKDYPLPDGYEVVRTLDAAAQEAKNDGGTQSRIREKLKDQLYKHMVGKAGYGGKGLMKLDELRSTTKPWLKKSRGNFFDTLGANHMRKVEDLVVRRGRLPEEGGKSDRQFANIMSSAMTMNSDKKRLETKRKELEGKIFAAETTMSRRSSLRGKNVPEGTTQGGSKNKKDEPSELVSVPELMRCAKEVVDMLHPDGHAKFTSFGHEKFRSGSTVAQTRLRECTEELRNKLRIGLKFGGQRPTVDERTDEELLRLGEMIFAGNTKTDVEDQETRTTKQGPWYTLMDEVRTRNPLNREPRRELELQPEPEAEAEAEVGAGVEVSFSNRATVSVSEI